MATFSPIPIIPEELINAAQAGELVVFVGAGVSKLVSGPSWDEFADAVLNQLVLSGKIDYFTLSQIRTIADPRKRLSIANIISRKGKHPIDYSAIFRTAAPTPNIYSHLNTFNCSFVTTNYDLHLAPEVRKTLLDLTGDAAPPIVEG